MHCTEQKSMRREHGISIGFFEAGQMKNEKDDTTWNLYVYVILPEICGGPDVGAVKRNSTLFLCSA